MRRLRSVLRLPVLLTVAACSAPDIENLPLLEHAYHPSASAPARARVPTEVAPGRVHRDGKYRRHVVTGPDGAQYALRWRKVSESVGGPGSGRLVDAARLPERGPGFLHTGDNPFGTDETVAWLRYAAWAVAKMYPDSCRLLIRDLSDEDGGRLPPHRSHRSGRDVDVGWYPVDNRDRRWFEDPGDNLDLARSWTFIEALLRTGAVQYVFIDRSLQERLYDHALKAGWERESLDAIFQHPGGRKGSLIRHVRGHRNHMHIRFLCPEEDEECER